MRLGERNWHANDLPWRRHSSINYVLWINHCDPATKAGVLQPLTNNTQCSELSAAVDRPNWRVVCSIFTQLMMLLFNGGWRLLNICSLLPESDMATVELITSRSWHCCSNHHSLLGRGSRVL